MIARILTATYQAQLQVFSLDPEADETTDREAVGRIHDLGFGVQRA